MYKYTMLNIEMHKQTEIAKRLNDILAQIMPFLSQEHQQQVAQAVECAKQVTLTELNAIIVHIQCFNLNQTHYIQSRYSYRHKNKMFQNKKRK